MEPWDAPKKLSEMMELEEIDPILKQMVQEYQIYVFSLEELQEEYFQTNLRELIRLMKRRSSKTKFRNTAENMQIGSAEWTWRLTI